MVVVGDLHLKSKIPYSIYQKEFLQWLLDNYNNHDLILLGDIVDSSAPTWDTYEELKKFLYKWNKEIYIIQGNHDFSARRGSVLQGLDVLENVTTIREIQEIVIENSKCLFLPYIFGDMKDKYESLKGTYDFVFSHITHPKDAFGDEGIDLSAIDCEMFIYGHTHTINLHHNKNQQHHILGVPIPTRHLEHEFQHRLFIYDENGSRFQDIPEFFSFETIKFGQEPKNKKNIINVIDAPDINSVYDRYKDYYIRREGIKLKRTDADFDKIEFDMNSMKEQFVNFAKENDLKEEIINTSLEYFEQAGV